jgi:bifunctional non-homologous end joining protein LigD
LGFQAFLRTTGGKGVHLAMALAKDQSWPLVKGFAEAFAKAMAREYPSVFTAVASKARREGRIYIDYLRNARGASAVASYSLRARPGFPVATPLFWNELRKVSGGAAFDRQSVVRRLQALSADPWEGFDSTPTQITAKMRRDVGLKT